MSECIEPTHPGDDAPASALLLYYTAYAEYIQCLIAEGGGQPYPQICANISNAADAASKARAKLTLVTTPPPPLPLTPTGTLSGLMNQLVSVGQDAQSQDLASQAGQTKAYQDMTWAVDWLKPASKTGTLAQLAGC